MKTLFIFILVLNSCLFSQIDSLLLQKIDSLNKQLQEFEHRLDIIEKLTDDVLFFHRLSDICTIDKVFIYGLPNANVRDTTKIGWNNPVRFWSYVFIPKKINKKKKHPLLVFVHGGVHSNFSTYNTHILREMILQGYVVVAPEYRGSTGYGKNFYELIDYGGREIDDADASRKYVIENYPFVDSNRVGIVGWSHGGMIAIMCLFFYPQNYKVGFAGVPVSDLVKRIGYHGKKYEKYFSAAYHIGQTLEENPNEYRRRSPVSHAHKLTKPVLINTNTNDDDVYATEVLQLVEALKQAGKEFQFDLYENLPGGHGFDRIDTKLARQIRFKMYSFLAHYLKPSFIFRTAEELSNAAYPGMK